MPGTLGEFEKRLAANSTLEHFQHEVGGEKEQQKISIRSFRLVLAQVHGDNSNAKGTV